MKMVTIHVIAMLLLFFAVQLGVCQQIANDTIHYQNTYRENEPVIAAARDTNGVMHIAVSFVHQLTNVEIARAYSSDSGATKQ